MLGSKMRLGMGALVGLVALAVVYLVVSAIFMAAWNEVTDENEYMGGKPMDYRKALAAVALLAVVGQLLFKSEGVVAVCLGRK